MLSLAFFTDDYALALRAGRRQQTDHLLGAPSEPLTALDTSPPLDFAAPA